MARAIHVTDPAALLDTVARLQSARRIAMDTESNNMHAYRGKLCVLQICASSDETPADEVYVIDTLAIADLSPLTTLLGEHGPEVIIHDAAFDARLLASVGISLARVIDTAVHARFLGLRETGLAALLAARCGIQLPKIFQQHDWSRRPLTSEQLEYLTDDVAYLGPLAASLERDAATMGITAEIAVETEYVLANARVEEPPLPPYARIKGAGELSPLARAVLRELAEVRERTAARWNVPVGTVVSNQGLLAVAKTRPRTVAELRRVAGLRHRGAAIAGELLAAIQRGERAGDVPQEEKTLFRNERLPEEEISRRRARETALGVWRRREHAVRGVDPQVILPGHAMSDIARIGPKTLDELAAIPGVGAVRVERYGEAILQVLAQADQRVTGHTKDL